MRQIDLTIEPGETVDLPIMGDYVRLKTSNVKVRIESPEFGEFLDLDQGDAVRLTGFKRLKISHVNGAVQSITLLIGNGTAADSSKVGGSVTISSAVAFTSVQGTVTTASAQLLAAKALRKFLLIQNNDEAGIVYVNTAGAAATALNGIKIGPGGSLMLDNAVPSGAIFAIGSIASNANIVVVEG